MVNDFRRSALASLNTFRQPSVWVERKWILHHRRIHSLGISIKANDRSVWERVTMNFKVFWNGMKDVGWDSADYAVRLSCESKEIGCCGGGGGQLSVHKGTL